MTILGYGRMGRLHAETWVRLGYDIAEIVDTGLGQEPGWLGDIVTICTPDWRHGQDVLAALRRGKHVFCEKPLCTTFDELSKIQEAKRDQKLGLNLPLRHHPALIDFVNATPPGPLTLIEVDYNWGRLKNLTGWKLDPRYSIVHGGGIHVMDLIVWLTGQRPVWHAALGANRVQSGFAKPLNVQAIGYVPSGPLLRLGVNFDYDGEHSHVIRLHGRHGTAEHRNLDEVDKTVCLKLFDRAIKGTGEDNYADAVSATIGCLAVEAVCSRK